MATIYADLVSEHSYEEDDRSGTVIRHYVVSGLTSSSRITTDALYASDGATTIPRAGEEHPTLNDFTVRRVKVYPFQGSRTQCHLLVWYAKVRRRLLDVRLNGVSVNTNTNFDKDGSRLVVGYKSPATIGGAVTAASTAFPDPSPSDKGSSGYDYDYGEVPYVMNEDVLEIVYLEKGSPWTKREAFRRKLNKKPWQGGKAREWFCEDIVGQIDSPIPINLNQLPQQDVVTGDALFNWVTTYRFRRRPLPPSGIGWDPLILFTDLNTGRKPTDINPKAGGWPGVTISGERFRGNGWAVYRLYDEADFDDLKLVSAII